MAGRDVSVRRTCSGSTGGSALILILCSERLSVHLQNKVMVARGTLVNGTSSYACLVCVLTAIVDMETRSGDEVVICGRLYVTCHTSRLMTEVRACLFC